LNQHPALKVSPKRKEAIDSRKKGTEGYSV